MKQIIDLCVFPRNIFHIHQKLCYLSIPDYLNTNGLFSQYLLRTASWVINRVHFLVWYYPFPSCPFAPVTNIFIINTIFRYSRTTMTHLANDNDAGLFPRVLLYRTVFSNLSPNPDHPMPKLLHFAGRKMHHIYTGI